MRPSSNQSPQAQQLLGGQPAIDRMNSAHAAMLGHTAAKHADITISANHDPQYLDAAKKATGKTTLHSLDAAENGDVRRMVHDANEKHADGVRTEIAFDNMPKANVIREFDSWKKSLHHGSDDSLAAFYKRSHEKESAGLDHQLGYLEASEDQLAQLGKSGMRDDITFGVNDINKKLGAAKTGSHIDVTAPAKKAYLEEMEEKAAIFGGKAAASHAARVEIGNEPNGNAKISADSYALVEGSMYNAMKQRDHLGGMKVDMAAPMQMADPTKTAGYIQDVADAQKYYFGQDKEHILTDETNMHLYATRMMKNGAEQFNMHTAEATMAAYAPFIANGILPKDVDVSEEGVYERSRLWRNNGTKDGVRAKLTPEEQADADAVQAGDNYSLRNQILQWSEKNDLNLHGMNEYGYGTDDGWGPDQDTLVTSTGHNQDLTFAGMHKPRPH